MKEYRFDPEIEIDFKSLIPLRVQLFEKIRKAVIARRVAPGTRVISESQVAKTFSINRGTVHLAYTDLIQCGLFETKSARGGVRISPEAENLYRIPYPTLNLVLPFSFQKHIQQSNSRGSMEYIAGIFDRAAEKNISVKVVALPPPDSSSEEINKWLDGFLPHSIGIITMGSRIPTFDPVLKALLDYKNLPHVFLTGTSPLKHISSVTADVTNGVNQMLLHLKKQKINSLFLLEYITSQNTQFISSSNTRIQEVEKLAEKRGINCIRHVINNHDLLKKGGVAHTYLTLKDPPRTVFTSNDDLACRFIDEIKEKGYNVPEDVMVIGYDNIAPAEYALSSVYHDRFALGRAAVDLVDKLYNGECDRKATHKKIPTSFIVRKSSSR